MYKTKQDAFCEQQNFTTSVELMEYIPNTAPVGYSAMYNNGDSKISTCYIYKASLSMIHVLRITPSGTSSISGVFHWCSGGVWSSKIII